MNGLHLAFKNEAFDVCLTINMMSHIEKVPPIFQEIKRVLKSNGFFVANFPNMSGLYFPIGLLVNLFKRSLQSPVYSRWYSLKEIILFLDSVKLFPTVIIGQVIIPKKYCPVPIFVFMKLFEKKMSNSAFRYLLGDIIIKAREYR